MSWDAWDDELEAMMEDLVAKGIFVDTGRRNSNGRKIYTHVKWIQGKDFTPEQNLAATAPAERPASDAPAESPASSAPAESPASGAPAESSASGTPAESSEALASATKYAPGAAAADVITRYLADTYRCPSGH